MTSDCLATRRSQARSHNLAPGNHFAIFAVLITVQYLLDADTGRSLRPTCRAASGTLAKLGMSRRLAVANLIFAGIRSRLGLNVGGGWPSNSPTMQPRDLAGG